jgi:hypothetical protein
MTSFEPSRLFRMVVLSLADYYMTSNSVLYCCIEKLCARVVIGVEVCCDK